MADYLKRVADKELELYLEAFGAVLIVGPKWCGKTTTGLHFANSCIRMQDPDKRESYMATVNTKPSLLLRGDNPRLIDEWQEAPVLWDAVRMEVDRRGEEGLFILTGSTSVDETSIRHSGIGRISRLCMYPMSLYESGESTGEVSLRDLFEDTDMDIDGAKSEMEVEDIIFAACRGGWPGALGRKSDVAKLLIAREYFEEICNSDISTVDGTQRNPEWARVILRSYARNISTLVKQTKIYGDVMANYGTISEATIASYLNALERLFVTKELSAWCPQIRSASAIRAGKKREFVDPSIAIAALGLTPEYFYTDLKTFGFMFEALCIRDIRVYSQALGGEISYYHDRYGLEADAVLRLGDGRYALIEFKLGSREIEEGAKHLLQLKELIQKYNKNEPQVPLREPDLLLVITGGEMAYTRDDGVKIIPIACLKD